MRADLDTGSVAAKILRDAKCVHANQDADTLVEFSRQCADADVTEQGVVYADTGTFTGRSAKDKFIVDDNLTHGTIWWSNTNRIDRGHFDLLLADMLADAAGKELFHQQLFAGADPKYRFDVDVFTPSAWHALFIRHLLIRPTESELAGFSSNVSVVHLPDFKADPKRHGTKSSTAIALDLSRNIVLICGTGYAGEIKKSVFSLFNYHAPDKGVFPMHCSANVGRNGDTTLFFGLSGTGKTTLSTSADRALIGDDEHGWSKEGIFNLEGGCYAKAINLSQESEPEIYRTASQFGSVLENVTRFASGEPDFDDESKTENTRIAYPLSSIANRVDSGVGPAPQNVVLLAADAFGVLPPIARLTREQAIYYFLSGYTAKVAGTERGVTEPEATFSACFGAPFMARHPADYGKLMAERLSETSAQCWLLNTGWTGGAYGVGHRMPLKFTRRILSAALDGELDNVKFRTDPVFGLEYPVELEGVDPAVLDPRSAWDNPKDFDAQAHKLLKMFEENFKSLGPRVIEISGGRMSSSDAA